MKIQLRDKDILSGVYKYGILSTEQIGDLFFKNLHHTTIMRRLRILEKEKLILRIDSLPNNQSAWSLGTEGADFLRVEPPGRFTNRNTTLHDVSVSGVRIALERVGLCQNFSTEMELKKRINWKLDEKEKEFMQVPDGIFTAQAKDGESTAVVALEVELNPKNHARYKRIVNQYLAKETIGFVWYVVKTEGIAKTIFEQWKKARRTNVSPTFLISWVENTKRDAEKLEVYSAKTGKWIKLTEIFDLPRLSEKANPTPDQPLGREGVGGLGNQAA